MPEAAITAICRMGRDMSLDRTWWRSGVIYQIYIRSFQDADGDGVGDLEGIISRLDHLKGAPGALDVDAIWITPFNPSPMADFGYDVSNYVDVHPLFGDMDTFDRLVDECHARGLKIIVDFVPNHCSIEHAWFQESRSSRDNPKRDWFIWRDPSTTGGPPNNWTAMFGGPSWEFDPATGQYYFHQFLASQPDLNWRNSEVRSAISDAMRFWLDRGVDGLRVDAVQTLTEDELLRDNPPPQGENQKSMAGGEYLSQDHIFDIDWPDNIEIIEAWGTLFRDYPDRLLLGEVYLLDPVRMIKYYADGRGFDLCFNFNLVNIPWSAKAVRDAVEPVDRLLPPGAQIANVLGSHDEPRLATRFGENRARAAALLLMSLHGVVAIYQGDEIGTPSGVIPKDRLQDPWALAGEGLSRDPARTPMQWDPAQSASFGFTTGNPWLPMATDDPAISVAAQFNDPESLLSFYRELIGYRRRSDPLRSGDQRFLNDLPPGVFGFTREKGNQGASAFVHMGDIACEIVLSGPGKIAIATDRRRIDEHCAGTLRLSPDEAVIVESI
jgi:alpha-glucosidase